MQTTFIYINLKLNLNLNLPSETEVYPGRMKMFYIFLGDKAFSLIHNLLQTN